MLFDRSACAFLSNTLSLQHTDPAQHMCPLIETLYFIIWLSTGSGCDSYLGRMISSFGPNVCARSSNRETCLHTPERPIPPASSTESDMTSMSMVCTRDRVQATVRCAVSSMWTCTSYRRPSIHSLTLAIQQEQKLAVNQWSDQQARVNWCMHKKKNGKNGRCFVASPVGKIVIWLCEDAMDHLFDMMMDHIAP